MDKGAQKTMITPESTQDKATTVDIFISGLLNKTAKVTDYSPMTRYLNGKHIEVLYERLPKTGEGQQYVKTGVGVGGYVQVPSYGNIDSEMYFEWLISIVRGYVESTEELRNKAQNQLCRLILILADSTTWKDGYVLAKPYDWVSKLKAFEEDISEEIKVEIKEISSQTSFWNTDVHGYTEKLDEIIETLEEKTGALSKANDVQIREMKDALESMKQVNGNQMSDIAKMLELITTWMEKYAPIMDKIQRDYKKLSPTKVSKP
jgi:hypothetical protein